MSSFSKARNPRDWQTSVAELPHKAFSWNFEGESGPGQACCPWNRKTTGSVVLSYLLFSILLQFSESTAFKRRIASGCLRDSWSVVPLKGKIVFFLCVVTSSTLPGHSSCVQEEYLKLPRFRKPALLFSFPSYLEFSACIFSGVSSQETLT